MDSGKVGNNTNYEKKEKTMNSVAERIYLFLCWHIKAFGYAPAMAKLTEACKCTATQTERWLKRLASDGYIKLYLYPDGDFTVKIMIDPTTKWHANLFVKDGKIVQLISELPMNLFIWNDTSPLPTRIESEKDLDLARLKKKGIRI